MISIENINKKFENNHVLKDISFSFERRKTNLIIGESGSGKTTLLKILIGLYSLDHGKIFYDKRNFSSMTIKDKRKLRQEIGILFQGGALYDHLTVEENIMFPLTMFTQNTKKEKLNRVNSKIAPRNNKNRFIKLLYITN